jgi:hypothetical protein
MKRYSAMNVIANQKSWEENELGSSCGKPDSAAMAELNPHAIIPDVIAIMRIL